MLFQILINYKLCSMLTVADNMYNLYKDLGELGYYIMKRFNAHFNVYEEMACHYNHV